MHSKLCFSNLDGWTSAGNASSLAPAGAPSPSMSAEVAFDHCIDFSPDFYQMQWKVCNCLFLATCWTPDGSAGIPASTSMQSRPLSKHY